MFSGPCVQVTTEFTTVHDIYFTFLRLNIPVEMVVENEPNLKWDLYLTHNLGEVKIPQIVRMKSTFGGVPMTAKVL